MKFFSGASYADSLRFQRCIDLWRLALEVRVNTHSILYSDTCFTAQALVRLMLDLQDKYLGIDPNEFAEQGVPRFDDVYGVFELLNKNLLGKGLCGFIFESIYKRDNQFVFYLPTQMQNNCFNFVQSIVSNKKTLIVY